MPPSVVRFSSRIAACSKPQDLYGISPIGCANAFLKGYITSTKSGILLLTPAKKWKRGRYAKAYRHLRKQPCPATWLQARKTANEPIFDLLCKVLNVQNNQKQLPLQGLANVATFLVLGVLFVKISMLVNKILAYPVSASLSYDQCFLVEVYAHHSYI